jgi:hypothetical protein
MAININWGDSTSSGSTLNGNSEFTFIKNYSGTLKYNITLTGYDVSGIKEITLSGSNISKCPDLSDERIDITSLNLNNNFLNSIPFINSKMRILRLNYNSISGLSYSSANLYNLTIIELSNNNLSGNILPPTKYMTLYNVSNNSLTGYTQKNSSFNTLYQDLSGNLLSSTEVNKVLSDNNTYNTSSSGTIILNGSSMGAPTGQGITDKNALITKGFTVITN